MGLTKQVVFVLASLASTAFAAEAIVPVPLREAALDIADARVAFTARVNVAALTIHGAARGLRGSVRAEMGPNTVTLHEVRVVVPVASLSTGMAVRDRHMRERIFREGESEPDVVFTGASSACTPQVDLVRCEVDGELSIRGRARPVTMNVDLRAAGTRGVRASGTATILLSDWDIERPTQLGVTVENEVTIAIEAAVRGENLFLPVPR